MAALGELLRLAADISSELTARGIEHLVSGSLALAIHARPRMTYDIDLVVAVASLRLPEVSPWREPTVSPGMTVA